MIDYTCFIYRALKESCDWADFSSKSVIQQAQAINDIYCNTKWYALISHCYFIKRLWC